MLAVDNETSIIFVSTASVRDLCHDGNELLILAQKRCDTERRSSCNASSQRLLMLSEKEAAGVSGSVLRSHFSAFLATKETSRINFDPASRSMCLLCFACVLGVGLRNPELAAHHEQRLEAVLRCCRTAGLSERRSRKDAQNLERQLSHSKAGEFVNLCSKAQTP
jgi:hypothetical protein